MEVTHQNGSPRRGEQCNGEDNPILNYRRALLKGLEPLSLQTTPNKSQKCNFKEDALSNSVEFPAYSVMVLKQNLKKNSHPLNMEATHTKKILGSQTPHDKSIKCKSVEDALSNSLVLRHIFTFLDNEDLESCCNVCQDWRTVADPLVVAHFRIELGRIYCNKRTNGSHDPVQLADSAYNITVREGARYNRKSFTRREDFGVPQLLQVILTQKVSFSLRLLEGIDIQNEKVMDFLSKVGPLVLYLDFNVHYRPRMSEVKFCKLLLQKFPNLKKLNCSGFCPNDDGGNVDDQLFDTDLLQNKHKRLREIVFGYPQYTLSFVETVLKMCENLEKIEDFPLEFINAIAVARKGPALKSLLYHCRTDFYCHEMGETVVTAFEKLTRLQPKLTSLEFSSGSFGIGNESLFELVKPFLFSVLQSSHASLESLKIASPLRSDEVQYFPTLKGLKELELLQYPWNDGVFFTRGMPVKEMFPNVCKLGSGKIWDEAFIQRHLPENVICPWGTQITELSVNLLPVCGIPLLQSRFPFIQKLELKNTEDDWTKILLELSRFWPQLKSLTISLGSSVYDQMIEMSLMDGDGDYRIRLDHAFTGLPIEVMDQLEDPARNKNFTEEEIQGFKDRSVISKLKELRELKVFLREYKDNLIECKHGPSTYGVSYMRLTPVSNEFGFSLLPELAVTLVVEKLVHFAEEMEEGLEPLATCSNIKIVNSVDGSPYVFNNC